MRIAIVRLHVIDLIPESSVSVVEKRGRLCQWPDLFTTHAEAVPTAEVPHPWLVDGHYENTTKTYEIQYGDPKEFLQKMLNEENNARMAKKMEAKRAKMEAEGLLRD